MLTYSHILVTSAFSQEKISSVGVQPSADVSTLNHNVLRLVGRQWLPVTAHLLLASSFAPPFCARANMRLSLLLAPTCKSLLAPTCKLLLFCTGKPLQPIPMGEKPGLPPFVAALLDQVVVLGGFPLLGLITPVFPWDSRFHYDHFPSPPWTK